MNCNTTHYRANSSSVPGDPTLGIDDTDNPEGGGTGRVAREIAGLLAEEFSVLGVSRHQLLVDPRVPYTSNNSSNVIHLCVEGTAAPDRERLADRVAGLLVERCLPGSDPGLCIAAGSAAGHPFGRDAQQRLVTQAEALSIARERGMVLRPLGGTGDGIIGALAGVLLASAGDDGRFVQVGRSRELDGIVTVAALLAAGVDEICTRDGMQVTSGRVDTLGGRVRPQLRGHRPVLLVEPAGGELWRVVELGKHSPKRKEHVECTR